MPAAHCLTNCLQGIVIQIEGNKTPASAATSSRQNGSTATAAVAASAASAIETVEWRKHSSVCLSDGFELRRLCSPTTKEVKLSIHLYLDDSPPRFRISAPLSHALGFPLYAPNPLPQHATMQTPNPFTLRETEAHVLAAFWKYVEKQGLMPRTAGSAASASSTAAGAATAAATQSTVETDAVIECDATLRSLFGVETMPVTSILNYLHLHMVPASSEPVIIPYTVQLQTAAAAAPQSLPFAGRGRHPVAPPPPVFPSPSPVSCYDVLVYSPLIPHLPDALREVTAKNGWKK